MSCTQCQGIENQFDRKTAEDDLKSYHKKGLPDSTRRLVDAIAQIGIQGATLLDIGGGVGMIQHELLKAGAARATHVDASSAYLQVSQEEAQRLGHRERVDYRYGNFVDLAAGIDSADIVTLDKVICCYDDMHHLVDHSSAKAKRFYGLVFPKDTWWTRLAIRIVNIFPGITDRTFRNFIHPAHEVEAIIRKNGLEPVFRHSGFFWQVAGYVR